MELMEDVCKEILFRRRYNDSDVLVVLNWLQDHHPVAVYQHTTGFLKLSYCGRCSTIVSDGDKYCNQCGRLLKWK